jgi:hypothetical protein
MISNLALCFRLRIIWELPTGWGIDLIFWQLTPFSLRSLIVSLLVKPRSVAMSSMANCMSVFFFEVRELQLALQE